MVQISIIICTYNPDLMILQQCLMAIFDADKNYPVKEILLIDNNSSFKIGDSTIIKPLLTDYSKFKIIIEPRQGLTYARLAGIQHSTGDLIIFVDDDNFVRQDYFLQASLIYADYPFIGAFSGQVNLKYKQPPPIWTEKYWGMLVHRLFEDNRWGNQLFNNDIMPNGAGLCIHRKVANQYVVLHESGSRQFTLDRTGQSLLSGGDNDLAMCAIDINMGMGLFTNLYLEHYIQQKRFSLEYLSRLTEGIAFSAVVLKYMRTGQLEFKSIKRRWFDRCRSFFMTKEDKEIMLADYRGLDLGLQYIKDNF